MPVGNLAIVDIDLSSVPLPVCRRVLAARWQIMKANVLRCLDRFPPSDDRLRSELLPQIRIGLRDDSERIRPRPPLQLVVRHLVKAAAEDLAVAEALLDGFSVRFESLQGGVDLKPISDMVHDLRNTCDEYKLGESEARDQSLAAMAKLASVFDAPEQAAELLYGVRLAMDVTCFEQIVGRMPPMEGERLPTDTELEEAYPEDKASLLFDAACEEVDTGRQYVVQGKEADDVPKHFESLYLAWPWYIHALKLFDLAKFGFERTGDTASAEDVSREAYAAEENRVQIFSFFNGYGWPQHAGFLWDLLRGDPRGISTDRVKGVLHFVYESRPQMAAYARQAHAALLIAPGIFGLGRLRASSRGSRQRLYSDYIEAFRAILPESFSPESREQQVQFFELALRLSFRDLGLARRICRDGTSENAPPLCPDCRWFHSRDCTEADHGTEAAVKACGLYVEG